MRNFLTLLALLVLTLTTSSVFAEKFDASRRTERFGLSFYDGRPLYFAYLYGRPTVMGAVEYRMETYRVHTGEVIEDLGRYDELSGGVYPPSQGGMAAWCFYARADDGQLTLICSGQYDNVVNKNPDHWVSQALLNFDPGVSAEDLAVTTYDNILPNSQDWARRGILLAVALLVLSTGSNKFRELTSGETQTTVKEEKKADATSSQEERATVRKIREAAKLGKLGGGLDERFLSESERREHDFITGKAFGLEFDDKVRASNKLFLDAFNRLPRYEQEALLQEWRVSSYTESYQGSVERRFIDWREGSGNDGATSRKQTDAFDNWFGSSDPFNDNDEEDGEPPF